MVFKNLFRRKARTILTLIGISIGIAAIVALGAVAQGMREGFSAMSRGSQADIVLSQADTMSVIMSRVDEAIGEDIATWPEVAAVDGVTFGNVILDDGSYLFISGYDPQGFAIEHFRIVDGESLDADRRAARGKPILLGKRAAESLNKRVGDTLRFEQSAFRIAGIYETGDSFEDGSIVLPLDEAQALALQPHHVSMIYLQLRDPADADRVREKVARLYPELALSTAAEFAEKEQVFAMLDGAAMGVAGMAVVIGGVVMTNTLFMSIMERTHEIGVLRSMGWRRRRVMLLILGESLVLSLLGAAIGCVLGVAAALAFGGSSSWLGALGASFTPRLFVTAFATAVAMGLVGGAYPAWSASRLLPVEALRYEGGGARRAVRVPGGMAVRNLWRRRTSTALTLVGIGISIAAIVALGALGEGAGALMVELFLKSGADILAIEADVDPDLSAIDDRVGARIEAREDVEAVSGMVMTAVSTEDVALLMVFGYHPRSFAIRHFRIVDGQPLAGGRQVIVGSKAAEQMGLEVGDSLRLLNSNFRVVGIYETGLGYEEVGVVIGLREAQALTGKPRQVMYYSIKVRNPREAEALCEILKAQFPGVDFSLTTKAVEGMSDFEMVQEMVAQVSFLAVLVGSLGMLNTMLMSVLERTREIGVLRALGWRRRQVLSIILRESLILGALGGGLGMLLGVGLTQLLDLAEGIVGEFEPVFTSQLFVQAGIVALLAGLAGGLYPAWRATRLRPVEALRYE